MAKKHLRIMTVKIQVFFFNLRFVVAVVAVAAVAVAAVAVAKFSYFSQNYLGHFETVAAIADLF